MLKYKIGDTLKCIPGSLDTGSGYKEGETMSVRSITAEESSNPIYWPEPRAGNGVYESSLILVSTSINNTYEIYG